MTWSLVMSWDIGGCGLWVVVKADDDGGGDGEEDEEDRHQHGINGRSVVVVFHGVLVRVMGISA